MESALTGRLLTFPIHHSGDDRRPLAVGVPMSWVAEATDPPAESVPFREWSEPSTCGASHPHVPPWVRGVTQWREQSVILIDVAGFLGLPAGGSGSRLVVLRPHHDGRYLGLLAGLPVRMLKLPVPHGPCVRELAVDRSRIRTAVELADRTLVVLDLMKLFDEVGCPAVETLVD